MNSGEAIETLRRSQRALRERGVVHAALVGSLARGDHRLDSDIDIMIEIDPDVRMTVFDTSVSRDILRTFSKAPSTL
jgi:uncharacterized protein